jgi:hypothetical protein
MFMPTPPLQELSNNTSFVGIAPLGGAVAAAPVGPSDQKYVTDAAGVRRLNRAYVQKERTQDKPQFGGADVYAMLPVCATAEEKRQHLPAADFAPAYDATLEAFVLGNAAAEIGQPNGETALEQLGAIFARHQAPLGLMNKLLLLSDFEAIEVIVDDSGSMSARSALFGSRWHEVRARLMEMVEIIAYVPAPPVFVRFLNMKDILKFQRLPQDRPADFAARSLHTINAFFNAKAPYGGTPAREVIETSLKAWAGRAVVRYFFGDGQPNGGASDIRSITAMIASRPDPPRNPFTFVSCTDDDRATVWMKECEEAAMYCAEVDDFQTELREVRADQGDALPYTYGTYLVCTLVGALCPQDLDCMDESIPMTKATLENMLGYVLNAAEYRYYFDRMLAARAAQCPLTPMDRLKASKQWGHLYQHFLAAPCSTAIPEAHAFRCELQRFAMNARTMY